MDHPIKEAIILAGGFGTRLKSEIGDLPKPLAPIRNKPFLHYLFHYLKKNHIQSVILSVGYQWQTVQKLIGNEYLGISVRYAIEEEALGTGGGLRLAMEQVFTENFFVLNGDTYFDIPLQELAVFHLKEKNGCTLAAKELSHFDRYGTLEISANGSVINFREKMPVEKGIINAGVYCMNKEIQTHFPQQDTFSFEQDYLEKAARNGDLKALIFDSYFKDIGIPEDYQQFEKDMPAPVSFSTIPFNKEWTLFLDRDGVINERLIDDYVKQLNELAIIEGVPEAIAVFSNIFRRIVVVTNQQGIGKGRMTAIDLEIIHGYMNNLFENTGGHISKFYFAPQLASELSNYRKPGTGMAHAAQKDYPDINFEKCLMIGDSESDIEFGMKLGMKTIMLTNVRNISTKADYIFKNLQQVAEALQN